MKKRHILPLFFIAIIMIFQSCAKDTAGYMPPQPQGPASVSVINIKLAPNELYQLAIDKSSTVNIAKQASHYQISQTAADTKSSATLYSYMPAKDFSGEDEVMLNISKTIINSAPRCGNGTGSSYTSSSSTIIKLKVGN